MHPADNWISQANELFPSFQAGWNKLQGGKRYKSYEWKDGDCFLL